MCEMYNRIESLCNKKNINVTIMCNEIEINRNILSNYKVGRSKSLSSDVLIKISKYFNVTTDYLLLGKEEKQLTENENELLNIFKKINEREQIKLIGKIEIIINKINEE